MSACGGVDAFKVRLSSPARPHRPLPSLASLPARLDPGQLGLLCVSGNGLPFWKVYRDPLTVSSAHTDPVSCTKALVDQQLVCVLNTQVLREVGPTCHHCSRMFWAPNRVTLGLGDHRREHGCGQQVVTWLWACVLEEWLRHVVSKTGPWLPAVARGWGPAITGGPQAKMPWALPALSCLSPGPTCEGRDGLSTCRGHTASFSALSPSGPRMLP